MSASSPIAICNRSLTLVGGNTITSFLDDREEAKLCNIHYAQVRDAVTAAYQWTHATRRFGPLTPAPTPPAYGYDFMFTLPPDLLQLVMATQDTQRGEYELRRYALENNMLLADESDNVFIKYIARVEDTTRFVQLFTEAFVARLAAELATPLAESRTLAEQMFKLYEAKIDEAAAVDNLPGRSQRTTTTRARRARWRHGAYGPGFFRAGQ